MQANIRPNIQKVFDSAGSIENPDGNKLKTLLGWHLANTGVVGTAQVLFRDGNGGDILLDIQLAENESIGESLHIQNSYFFESGLWIDIVDGTIRGSVRGRT